MPILIHANKTCQITLDPNDQYPEAEAHALTAAGGLLIEWVKEYFHNVRKNNPIEEPSPSLKEFMQFIYQCGELIPIKMTMRPDSSLAYPGDPDMHPLILINQPEYTDSPLQALIYQYGIITLIQDDVTFITRMD